MDPSANSPPSQLNLAILVGTIQSAVNAQNLIATNIKDLVAAFTTFLATYPTPIIASKTWDPPSTASGTSSSTTVTVTGATLGNFVEVSFSNDLQGMTLVGYVSAANTVTAVLSNLTGGTLDLASGTLKARVVTQ